MEAGKKSILETAELTLVFLSFSEKMMKTTASKKQTDGAGKRSSVSQEAWELSLTS